MKRKFVLETVRNLGVGLVVGSLIAPIARPITKEDIVYVILVLAAGLILIALSIILYKGAINE